MAANSLIRRAMKKMLAPVLTERSYRVIQAVAMAWDIRTGAWDDPEIDLIARVVRPGDTVIDIGANFGLYAWHLSRAVGPGGHVYAFEPIPFTASVFRLVSRLLRFNRSVQLINKGCGERAGTVSFRVPLQESGAIIAGLVHMAGRDNDRPGRKENFADFDKTKEIQAEIVAVDEYFPDLQHLTLLKCDIEGADYWALKGSRRTLERNRPLVIVEIIPWMAAGFGIDVKEMIEFFAGLKYGLYRYERRTLHRATVEEIQQGNWVFVPDERLAAVTASIASAS
jgi:FkbM family methyltransferase